VNTVMNLRVVKEVHEFRDPLSAYQKGLFSVELVNNGCASLIYTIL
jgi:hypothetical protein